MTLFPAPPMVFNLRPMWPHQAEIFDNIRRLIPQGMRRQVVPLATGGGKTMLATHIFASALSKGGRGLFTVPRLSLLNKTVQAFEECGITDIGIIQRNHHRTNHDARIQIASMASLIKRPDLMQGYSVVIVDECRIGYDEFYAWMKREKDAGSKTVFIGLDATPGTRGMGLHWDCMVPVTSNLELQRRGVLVPFEVYDDGRGPDRRKVKSKDGEFVSSAADGAMRDKALVADVYKSWVDRGSKSKWFVFGQTCAHAQELRAIFEENGVRCGYIDADTPQEERENDKRTGILDLYVDGHIDVMFSVGCLGMGVDVTVYGMSLAYMSKSRMKVYQDLGRGGRVTPNKTKCYVNDHGGNIAALGLPEDYIYAELDMNDPKTPGEAQPKMADATQPVEPKRCVQCKTVLPARMRRCPNCGNMVVPTSEVVTLDGVLVKREKGATDAIHAVPAKKEKKPPKDVKQDFYSGLLQIAQRRGFNPHWASHKYRENFLVWPQSLIAIPKTPNKAVREFVAAKDAEYRRQKAQEKVRA